MTAIATSARSPRALPRTSAEIRTTGIPWLLAVELGASVVGFAVVLYWARALGPAAFADVEYAAAVAAWLLVVVRGGVDVVVYREAARRPRLIHGLTELVIGIRCACAVLGSAIVLVVACSVGPERGAVVVIAGLVLVPSAFVADVGLRAEGRLGWIALAQVIRALGYAAAGFCLVADSSHALRAAACGVLGEVAGWFVPFGQHAYRYGLPRPRFRRRAWTVLAHRGAITSLIRFGRVSLYGADLLVLGWWAGGELGPYAAARRIVFGLVAIGLVIPSAVAPAIARTWLTGAFRTRLLLDNVNTSILLIALPASVGLAMTAERWMSLLFGATYGEGGAWLALVAARLPWLLSASLSQAALVACRREKDALRLALGLLLLTAVLMPSLGVGVGPAGVGSAALTIEMMGAVGGWLLLNRMGVAPPIGRRLAGPLSGTIVLAIVCILLRSQPLGIVCLISATAYAIVATVGHRWSRKVSAAGVWMS